MKKILGILLGIVFLISLASAITWDNPYYYKFDSSSGTNVVESVIGLDGTTYNMEDSDWVTGKINNALRFGGVNESVNTSLNIGIVGGQDRTVSFWANLTNYSSPNYYGIVGWGNSTVAMAYQFGMISGNYSLSTSGLDCFKTVAKVIDGYQHIVIRYNNSATNNTLWVNGTYIADCSVTLDTANTILSMGSLGLFSPRYAEMDIDELGIWNRTLTDTEIAELYNGGSGLEYGGGGVITVNSASYNSTVYETDYAQTYSINISNGTYTSLSASLIYNSQTYTTTKTSGDGWTTFSVSSVEIGSAGSQTITWNVTAVNSTDTYSENKIYLQTVSPIQFGLCNATLTVPYINLTFQDESTLSSLNANITSSTWTYWLGSGSSTKSYSFSNATGWSSYAFCFDGNNRTLYMNPYVQYAGTGYPQRIYQPATLTLNNTVTNKLLYLLGSGSGVYENIQVLNAADQTISGATVTVYREISGDLVIVGSATTGDNGVVSFWLNPDYLHYVNVTASGYSNVSLSFFPLGQGQTIVLGGGIGVPVSCSKGISYYLTPTNSSLINDTTYDFGMLLTSSYWDIDSYGFNLRLSNGTTITGSSTSTSGTQLTYSYDVNNQTIIYMDYYWVITDECSVNGTRSWVIYNTDNTQWSIANFFTDLKAYLATNMFGIDNFGIYLIIYLFIFITVGIISFKFGFSNPLLVFTVIFIVVFSLDVVFGIIPTLKVGSGYEVPYLLTFITGLILVILIIREVASK